MHAQLVAESLRHGLDGRHRLPPLGVRPSGAAVRFHAAGDASPLRILVVGQDHLSHALGGEQARHAKHMRDRGRPA